MEKSLRRGIFPWLSLFMGVMAMALQGWLFSSADDRGLLPFIHIATILSLILLVATLGVCLFVVPKGMPASHYNELFPRSTIAAVGTAIAAIGILVSTFFVSAPGILGKLTPILGVAAGCALLVTAYCRFQGLRPNCLLHCVVVVFFITRTMAYCQQWGSEPQLQVFFFPLLSSLFLLITSYYRAELDLFTNNIRRYIFFSQGAMLCCLAAVVNSQWLFYLSATIWLATDFIVLPENK